MILCQVTLQSLSMQLKGFKTMKSLRLTTTTWIMIARLFTDKKKTISHAV